MDFSEKGQEVAAHSENILNFPYSNSKEEQEEPVEKASSSKPTTQRINQLLRQVYEIEILEREIKKNNVALTSRNKILHKSYLEQRERYIFLKRLNTRYLKYNTRLYMMIILQKLQMKEAKLNPNSHLPLETLAKAAVSLQPLETSQDVVNPPSIEPTEEQS